MVDHCQVDPSRFRVIQNCSIQSREYKTDKITQLLTQTHVGQLPAKFSTLHLGIKADFR